MKKQKDFYQVSLKILLKNRKGEILGLRGVDDGTFAGFYDLPGGRIDTDEFKTNINIILSRELREEVGFIKFKLDLKPVALGRHLILKHVSGIRKEIRVLYVFFEAKYLGGKIKISQEHTGYEWINLKIVNLKKYFKSGILEGVEMYLKK